MKRLAPLICALALATGLPAAALGAQAGHGTVTGKVTYVGGSTLTIQTAGRMLGVVNALTATANAISAHVYPYVYGGGHGEAGVPSIGIKGPGYNGRRIGYDCSGSVAAVLAGAGLWAPGSAVPNDAGVIGQLLQERLIARGAGQAPDEVTCSPQYSRTRRATGTASPSRPPPTRASGMAPSPATRSRSATPRPRREA